MPIGSYVFHRTSLDREQSLLVTISFAQRHEVAAGTLIASASFRVLAADAASSAFTLASPAVDPTGTMAQTRVTDAGAAAGAAYSLVCDATLSDGTVLVESVALWAAQA